MSSQARLYIVTHLPAIYRRACEDMAYFAHHQPRDDLVRTFHLILCKSLEGRHPIPTQHETFPKHSENIPNIPKRIWNMVNILRIYYEHSNLSRYGLMVFQNILKMFHAYFI